MKTKSMIMTLILSSLLFSCSMNSNDNSLPAPEKASETSKPEPVTPAAPAADPVNAAKPAVSANRMLISPDGSAVTFTCKAESTDGTLSYQWYSSPDGSEENKSAIDKATSATYTTEAFTQKEIRYYFCTITNTISDNGDKENKTASQTTAFYAAYTGLPVIQIITNDGLMPSPSKEKHNGRMYLYRNKQLVYDSGDANEFSIKVRGNATAGYPKHPYKLKLPEKKNLLDLDSQENKDKNWVLLAGYCDKTLLRTKIGFYTASLFNDIDNNEKLYVPHSEFVDVVINGEYIGNYCLTDSVKEGTDRLAVNEKTKNPGGIGVVAEYDPNYYANEAKWVISDKKKYPYTFKFPDAEENDAIIYSTIGNFGDFINKFESAFYDTELSNDWTNYIDIESFARWFLAHNILKNLDTNFFLSKKTSDSTSKIIMGPVWDFEWSIGIGWYYGSRPSPADGWCVNGWYFSDLLNKEEFKIELKNQWEKLLSIYSNLAENINSKMDEWANEINISQQMNFKKWNILNEQVSVGGIPLGGYENELECDKQFIINRFQWLDTAINNL